MSFITTFTKTCGDVSLGTCVAGTTFVDPCDCTKRYVCDLPLNNKMITSTCPNTTAWDNVQKACDFYVNVINAGRCDQNAPWSRCNVTESRELELQERCTGITPSTSTTTPTTSTTTDSTTPNSGSQGSSSSLDSGVAVGLVIAGVALALIIVGIVVFLFYRRRKAKLSKKSETAAQMNPEYFEGNDPYATIDESLNVPVYNHGGSYMEPIRPPLPISIRGTLMNGDTLADTLSSGTQHDQVEYDNSASIREPAKDSETEYIILHGKDSHQATKGMLNNNKDNEDIEKLKGHTFSSERSYGSANSVETGSTTIDRSGYSSNSEKGGPDDAGGDLSVQL